MNLTKKMSVKNNFSSEEEETSNLEDFGGIQLNDASRSGGSFLPFNDYHEQKWPLKENTQTQELAFNEQTRQSITQQ